MRRLSVVLLLLAVGLAGCASGDDRSDQAGEDAFRDLDIQVDQTSGVILGIVIDPSVRPLAGVDVRLEGTDQTTVTDDEGRFVLQDVAPGVQEVTLEKAGYHPITVQTSVEPGVASPPLLRLTIERIFSQDPFTEQFPHRGFLECSQAGIVYSSAPCIHDYSGLAGGQLAGTGPCTNDGCLPVLEEVTRDDRYFLSGVGPGWQTQIWELTWQPSASATSQQMGFVVSHDDRLGGHRYAEVSGENPVRGQIDVGEPHPRATADSTAGNQIPPEGKDDLVFFVSVRRSILYVPAVALQQDFEVFHTKFYYGVPDKEDWSVVAGDEVPF